MSRLLDYYRGEGVDGRGRTLAQVQAQDHRRMEDVHDFIQWMFPLRTRSAYNANAPTLTDDDVAAFRAEPLLRDHLGRSFAAFLDFLGLVYDPATRTVAEKPGAPGRALLAEPNHNWLRITRVLLCLKTLGLDDEAAAFFAYLGRAHRAGIGVDDDTFAYWSAAAEGHAR